VLLADWIVEHLMNVEAIPGLGTFGISKHVLGLFVVAILLLATFIPFGARVGKDIVPRGRFQNAFEAMLLFIRDDVARPYLGKAGDKFLPMIWTIFFFVLYCNLLGLWPTLPAPVVREGAVHMDWSGVAPTGQIWVTGTLAVIAFLWWHALGIREQGLIAYIKNIVPGGVPLILVPFLFLIEVLGHLIKPMALMVRLWANMMGGHTVVYIIMGAIFTYGVPVALGAVPAGVAIYFLELFVAFFQAYVFSLLVSVFLGMAVHPDH
jgi:F-type H+-transporting ATPase subunit a